MTNLRDTVLLLINFGLPVYLVAKMGWRGVIAGTFVMWVIVLASGEIQRAGDLHAQRFGMGLWLATGWLFTLAFWGIIYGLRQFILWIRVRWGGLDISKLKYKN